jgi:hypothetical protein
MVTDAAHIHVPRMPSHRGPMLSLLVASTTLLAQSKEFCGDLRDLRPASREGSRCRRGGGSDAREGARVANGELPWGSGGRRTHAPGHRSSRTTIGMVCDPKLEAERRSELATPPHWLPTTSRALARAGTARHPHVHFRKAQLYFFALIGRRWSCL